MIVRAMQCDGLFCSGLVLFSSGLVCGMQGTANVTVAEAEKRCSAQESCVGFTFEKTSAESTDTCEVICGGGGGGAGTGVQKILFKSSMSGSSTDSWCKVLKPASPVGVFFENVQPLSGSFKLV
jgi:hypothetical protein